MLGMNEKWRNKIREFLGTSEVVCAHVDPPALVCKHSPIEQTDIDEICQLLRGVYVADSVYLSCPNRSCSHPQQWKRSEFQIGSQSLTCANCNTKVEVKVRKNTGTITW